jgi:cardiolipin synthase
MTIAPDAAVNEPAADADIDPASRFRRAIEGVIGVPATEHNRVDVLRNGDEIFPAMLESIGRAQHTVDLLTFVYWKGEVGRWFAEALAERAHAGVRVRVLLDAWGARTIERSLLALLEDAGVTVRWFRPLGRVHIGDLNHRTHRKVMIVDEAVGYTGGVGIADQWRGDADNAGHWRDTHFRITGPAVDGLRAAFLDNWSETDPELFDETVDRFPHQPRSGDVVVQCVRGASETGNSDIYTLFRTLLQLAEHRVRIATAYFVPDDEIVGRLCAAARRGVTVELLLPGPHADKRFVQLASADTFAPLFDAGIAIWAFQPSMLHAKVMTVDGIVSNVGSANLNARSTALDEEVNVVAIDPALTAILDRHFDDDLARSERVDADGWQQRSFCERVVEAATRPFRGAF